MIVLQSLEDARFGGTFAIGVGAAATRLSQRARRFSHLTSAVTQVRRFPAERRLTASRSHVN